MKWKGVSIPTAETPLFGVYHQPLSERPISEAVLICYPAPFEIRRSYRAFRNLAQSLARKGYHVLRFDYRGTGDSPGTTDDWSLEAWQKDIRAAVEFLKKEYAIQRVSVVGTRLGACLAWNALREVSVRRLVLWDPVVRGQDYYQQLLSSHHRLLHTEKDKPPFPIAGVPQCLGFALNETWVKQLQDISMDLTEERRATLVVSADHKAAEEGSLPLVAVDEAQHWDDPFLLQMQSFSHKALAAIEEAIEGKA